MGTDMLPTQRRGQCESTKRGRVRVGFRRQGSPFEPDRLVHVVECDAMRQRERVRRPQVTAPGRVLNGAQRFCPGRRRDR
jgi:hypothetical protein